MAIGDWVLKTWANGTDVSNATNWQRNENKLYDLDNQTKIVLKTANETVNNSSSYQNDDKLVGALTAGKKYEVKLFLKVKAGGQDSDIKSTWTYSGSLNYGYRYALGMGYGGTYPIGDNAMLISCDVGEDVVSGVDNTFYTYVQETLLVSALTTGNLQLRWAQYSARAHDTIVYAGSYMKITEVGVT